MHDTRQRGLSHRYSQAAGTELGRLTSENGYLEEMFPWKMRVNKARWYAVWGLVNALLLAYCVVVTGKFWSDWQISCIKELDLWLLIYVIITALHLVRTIAIIFVLLKAKDPATSTIKMEAYFGVWVFLFEVVWLIYGNSFIYTDDVKNCHSGEGKQA